MTTKFELQDDLRMKQHQERVLHERRRSSQDKELKCESKQIVNEQKMLHRQHERLEKEKRHYKGTSFLTRDRQLFVPGAEKLPLLATKDLSKTTAHSPDRSQVQPEQLEPRGRRQLLQNTEETPAVSPSSSRVIGPMSSHAFEASKASYTDIVRNIARLPHATRAVSFKDKTDDTDSSHPYSRMRRGSLQSPRRESVSTPSPRRRYSLPANQIVLPKTRLDAAPDYADDNECRLRALYNKAIETVQLADESLLAPDGPASHRFKFRRNSTGGVSMERSPSSGLDLATLKELESILSDARLYSNRKCSKEDHRRLDVGTNRAQRKRIEHLEQVLNKLNPNYDANSIIDPVKVLQCSYLRLSKSNVETLENMIIRQGKDPGIHIHSDVTDYDIWTGLKEERTDLQHPEMKHEKQPQKPRKSVYF